MSQFLSRHTATWLLLTALVLAACSSDNEGQGNGQQELTLQILSLQKGFTPLEETVTRGVPSDFSTNPTPIKGTSITLFLTQGASDYLPGTFYYVDGEWKSRLFSTIAKPDCYIYGYMPTTNEGSIVPRNSNYANGAVITFSSLPPITKNDLCVITGIKQFDTSEALTAIDGDVKEGAFGCTIKTSPPGNYLYVLLDHLYACLEFRFTINDTYAKLRTIKLKQVELMSTQAATVSATVTLRANNEGASPIENTEWTHSGSETDYVEIFSSDDGENLNENPVATAQFAPIYSEGQSLTLRCTYDVYTADGTNTLVSKDRVAENRITQVVGMTRGQKRTITVTVNPTYLYVLADPDLDNPTITIN